MDEGELEVQRRDKCAQHASQAHSNGRRSRIHGRNSGGVHRQVQKIFIANRLGLFQKTKEK